MKALCGLVACFALALTAANPAAAQGPLPGLPPVVPPGGGDPEQPAPTAPAAPVGQAPGSVVEGVDVANTGSFPDESIVPPLQRRWQVKGIPDGPMLAAEGRLYYVAAGVVHALDQRDGRELWAAPAAEGYVEIFYDGGLVFAQSEQKLAAFDAATGAAKWSRNFKRGRSIATGGVVYLSEEDSGTAALSATDGHDLWRRAVRDPGRPTVDDQRVYVPGPCGAIRALNRVDGNEAWTVAPSCSSVPDNRPSVFGGRVFPAGGGSARDGIEVYDAASGSRALTLAGPGSVFVDGLALWDAGLFGQRDALVALDAATGAERWSSRRLGDRIAVGHDIFGLGPGEKSGTSALHALDAESGVSFGAIPLDHLDLTQKESRFGRIAVAPGALFVSSSGYISAWESVLRPDPQGIALGFDTEVVTGKQADLVAVVGSSMRAGKPDVGIEMAGWRGGAFRAVGAGKAFRDGGADLVVTPTRNTRVRARVGNAVSNPATVYVWPDVRFGRFRWIDRRRVRVTHSIRSPGVNVTGRRLVMYLERARNTKKLTRVASGRLRAAGRGRARATMTFRPPKTGRKDHLYLCLEGGLARGLGRPIPLTRRCGAGTIRQ